MRPKSKGNLFENEVYRQLKKYGARKTIGSGSAKDESGDIEFKNYIIDTKHRKDFSFTILKEMLDKHTEKVRKVYGDSSIPVIVFKKNYWKPIVAFYSKGSMIVMLYEDWVTNVLW
jgi:hypothetical protein